MLRCSLRPLSQAALRPSFSLCTPSVPLRSAAAAASFPATFPSDSRSGGSGDDDMPTHMPFGKHKGLRLEDIPPSYVTWLEREGALDKRPELKRAFASLGRVEDALQYDYTHLKASHLNPFVRNSSTPRPSLPPFWGAGMSFLPSGAAPNAEAPAALSPEAIAALEPFREVPKSLPPHLVFFDLETVHTSTLSDLANNHIAQIGAVDGTGREFQAAVRPPVAWSTVAAASSFFVENDFQRFFRSPNDFRGGWDLFRRWLWDPAQGRGRVGERARAHAPAAGEVPSGSPSLIYNSSSNSGSKTQHRPVVLIGHNMIKFDLLRVDKELRRLGSLPPPLLAAAAAAAGTSLETTAAADLRSELFSLGGVRCIDTLDIMSRFTGLENSPAKGAWALGNLLTAATGSPPTHAHDAVDDARSVRALFFADNLLGTFFRAELARQLAAAEAAAEFDAAYIPAVTSLPGAELGLLPTPAVPAAAGAGAAGSEDTADAVSTVPVFGYDLPKAYAAATQLGFTAVVSLNEAGVAALPTAPAGSAGYSQGQGKTGGEFSKWRGGRAVFTSASGASGGSGRGSVKGYSSRGATAAAADATPAGGSTATTAATAAAAAAAAVSSDFGAGDGALDKGDGRRSQFTAQDVFRAGAGETIQPPVGHVDGDFIAE